MSTPLHSTDELVALAEGAPGPARDWASARLALLAPDRYSTFPIGESVPDVVVAAGPPGLVPSVIEVLETGEPPPSISAATSMLGTYGTLPEHTDALVNALHLGLRGDGSESDLWLVHTLAQLGRATKHELSFAARYDGPLRPLLLPAIVLRVSEQSGDLDLVAPAIAAEVRRQSEADPALLTAVLSALGSPSGSAELPVKDPYEAAQAGATVAGKVLPDIAVPRGSRRRRTQRWVVELLDGVPGASAALLRESFRSDPHPAWGASFVAVAAWLRSFTPGDPIDDVLARFGGADPAIVTAARRAVGPEHRNALLEQLRRRADPALGIVALPLLAHGDEELAATMVGLIVDHRVLDIRAEAVASVAAWHCADRIPALLHDKMSRDLGLLVAEWVPTEEVLVALLEMPIPADPDARTQHARCLAAMGDQATLPILDVIARADEGGTLGGVRALVAELLQTTLG